MFCVLKRGIPADNNFVCCFHDICTLASNRDVAVAVANTVAFGTVGMLLYPYLFHHVCSSSEQIGMCLGVAIHDTSQVLGSAMAYKETFGDELALKVAAV